MHSDAFQKKIYMYVREQIIIDWEVDITSQSVVKMNYF